MAAIAARQRGLATTAQLIAAGLSKDAIRHRLATGRLHLLHPRVYAVGHVPTDPLARDLAAILACGPGSVLSHGSAATVLGLLPRMNGPIHVSRQGGHHRTLQGVVLHRPKHLPAEDILLQGAVPATTPLRTLLDLSAAPQLDRALNEALVHRRVDAKELQARATGRLRTLLDAGPQPTRSEAERHLLRLVAKAGLPRPRTNVRIGGREVDAVWLDQRLVVEVDGYAYHHTRQAFERDRSRDADLHRHGYRILRLSWRQITQEPELTAATLAAALTRSS